MEDKDQALSGLAEANHWIMMGVIRFLVEEYHMPPDIAKMIVGNAVAKAFPENQSSGPLYDDTRDMILAFAEAIDGFPADHPPASRNGPQHDA